MWKSFLTALYKCQPKSQSTNVKGSLLILECLFLLRFERLPNCGWTFVPSLTKRWSFLLEFKSVIGMEWYGNLIIEIWDIYIIIYIWMWVWKWGITTPKSNFTWFRQGIWWISTQFWGNCWTKSYIYIHIDNVVFYTYYIFPRPWCWLSWFSSGKKTDFVRL